MNTTTSGERKYGFLIVLAVMTLFFIGVLEAPTMAKTDNHKVECRTGQVKEKGDGTLIGKIVVTAKFFSGAKDKKELADKCNKKYENACAGDCTACTEYTFDVHGGSCWDSSGNKVAGW